MKNWGMSFGIDFPGLTVVVMGVWMGLVYWTIREKSWPLLLAVIGGGLNLWERWEKGFVMDYWKIPLVPIYNNLNDWLIVAGIGLYLWKKLRS